ncbi:MAG: cell division protein FtsA [Candidatus Wolfebacteria bacterium]|nr:cell division protein FtsA [Candidatus Wolfebacteria bacterium]
MYFTALDIGSSQIKALVADCGKNNRTIINGVFKAGSLGLRRGEVVSPEDLVPPLADLFDEIRKINKSALKNMLVNVNGANIKFQVSRGIVAVSRADNEIYRDDIERVIKASQAVSIGPNRMMLHTLTKEYIVDGVAGIIDALGMIGNRLEVQSLIVDAPKNSVNNIIKCVEVAGGEIRGGLVYGPLAASQAVLSKTQKDLGVVMIDIGHSTTGVSIYEEGLLLHNAVLPIGAGNVTNDLAIGLRCPVKAAEIIKLTFGFASAKEIPGKEKLELREIDETFKLPVSRKFLSEIIEVRLAEIFELVNNELKLVGKSGRLPAGAVLAGGGAKMPGIVDLAKHELKLPVQIGIPEFPGLETMRPEFGQELEDPEFAVATGLLLWGTNRFPDTSSIANSSAGEWVKKVLKNFLP